MTLIELTFIILILSLMASFVGPRFGQVSGANLKKSATRLASLVRYVYDAAVVNNTVYRLQFEMGGENEQGTYWVEFYQPPISAESEEDKEKQAKDKATPGAEEEEDPEAKNFFPDAHLMNKPRSMLRGVKLNGIYRQGLEEVQHEGNVFIQFYPDGSVDPSVIYVSNEDGDKGYTISIHPLTGKTKIQRGIIEHAKALF